MGPVFLGFATQDPKIMNICISKLYKTFSKDLLEKRANLASLVAPLHGFTGNRARFFELSVILPKSLAKVHVMIGDFSHMNFIMWLTCLMWLMKTGVSPEAPAKGDGGAEVALVAQNAAESSPSPASGGGQIPNSDGVPDGPPPLPPQIRWTRTLSKEEYELSVRTLQEFQVRLAIGQVLPLVFTFYVKLKDPDVFFVHFRPHGFR
jgi:hypothetical protein